MVCIGSIFMADMGGDGKVVNRFFLEMRPNTICSRQQMWI